MRVVTPTANSPKAACVFPGAGIELAGYEREFYARHHLAMQPTLARVSALCGCDLTNLEHPEHHSSSGDCTAQAFTFAFSLGMYHALTQGEMKLKPALCAGHSLGIYAALVATESLSLDDGWAILERAYQLAQAAVADASCALAAITGLTAANVTQLASSAHLATIELVIHNNAASQVVAGEQSEVDELLKLATADGANRTLWLDRQIPYHHPRYLADASNKLGQFLDNFHWHAPRYPLVSTIDGRLLSDITDFKNFAAANLATPIAWEPVIHRMAEAGINTIIECGPGLTLTKMGRFIDSPIEYVNLRRLSKRPA